MPHNWQVHPKPDKLPSDWIVWECANCGWVVHDYFPFNKPSPDFLVSGRSCEDHILRKVNEE